MQLIVHYRVAMNGVAFGGTKRIKQVGRIEVPQEAFLAVLELER